MKGAGVGYSSFERLSVFENENSERGQSHPKETMNFNHPSNAIQEPWWKGTLELKICPKFPGTHESRQESRSHKSRPTHKPRQHFVCTSSGTRLGILEWATNWENFHAILPWVNILELDFSWNWRCQRSSLYPYQGMISAILLFWRLVEGLRWNVKGRTQEQKKKETPHWKTSSNLICCRWEPDGMNGVDGADVVVTMPSRAHAPQSPTSSHLNWNRTSVDERPTRSFSREDTGF